MSAKFKVHGKENEKFRLGFLHTGKEPQKPLVLVVSCRRSQDPTTTSTPSIPAVEKILRFPTCTSLGTGMSLTFSLRVGVVVIGCRRSCCCHCTSYNCVLNMLLLHFFCFLRSTFLSVACMVAHLSSEEPCLRSLPCPSPTAAQLSCTRMESAALVHESARPQHCGSSSVFFSCRAVSAALSLVEDVPRARTVLCTFRHRRSRHRARASRSLAPYS